MVLDKFGYTFMLSRLLPVPSTVVLFLCSRHLVALLLSFFPPLCQERQCFLADVPVASTACGAHSLILLLEMSLERLQQVRAGKKRTLVLTYSKKCLALSAQHTFVEAYDGLEHKGE